jgi:hypothetical protein
MEEAKKDETTPEQTDNTSGNLLLLLLTVNSVVCTTFSPSRCSVNHVTEQFVVPSEKAAKRALTRSEMCEIFFCLLNSQHLKVSLKDVDKCED